MKPASQSLCLDISAWVRGPTTAVGLCALRMSRELLALASEFSLEIEFFSRSKLSTDTKMNFTRLVGAPSSLRWAPFWRRWRAALPRQVFISFDHRLPTVCGAKKIIVVHDAWTMRANPWQSINFQRAQRPKIISAIARAEVIFCPSQQVATEIRAFDRLATGRLRVLPWGPMVDGRLDSPAFESRTLVMISTFENRKNHTLAFGLAALLGPDWRWIFVGANGYGARSAELGMEKLRAQGYRVERRQKLSVGELRDIYKESFGVLCPSFEEGFGLTVLEGLAMGRPVWASNIATHHEIAQAAATYFDPNENNLELLACQIKTLAQSKSLYEDRVRIGLERAQRFSWSATARQLLADL